MSACFVPDTNIEIPALMGETINTHLPLHGYVRNQKAPTEYKSQLEVRFATSEDLDALIALHRSVLARVCHSDDFREDSREYFAKLIDGGGYIVAIFADARLIAFGLLNFPDDNEEGYAAVLGFSRAQRRCTVQLESANVADDWVGNGLHLALVGWRIEIARAQGYRHICATAALGNWFSWNNLCLIGMRVCHLGMFYGGLQRYLLHRDLERSADLNLKRAVWIPVDDIQRQHHALEDGWLGFGYRGSRGVISLGLAPLCGG
ncbi:MAG: hypothetical protein GY814_13080 [Gammaproteobacteria bacterium]|nr:hypothetical protein [Gammaproteobacteria bacterium]